jgi:hypothetical protein
MKKRVLLAAVILAVVGVGSAIKVISLTPLASISASPTAAISIEDINRQADVKSLPVREVREPF